jgi:hypothetical protein
VETATRIYPAAVIRQTLTLYRHQAVVWLPGSVVVFGIAGILAAAAVAVSPLMIYVSFLISDVAIALFTAMVVGLVADTRDDHEHPSVGQLFGSVAPVFDRVVLVGVVAGIGIFIGFIAIVIPGLMLATVWAVATPVVVRERPRGLRALGRSRELVRGNAWSVFSVIFILVFLVGIVTSGIGLAADSAGVGVGVIVRVVVEIVTAPVGAFAGAVLYRDLSKREM